MLRWIGREIRKGGANAEGLADLRRKVAGGAYLAWLVGGGIAACGDSEAAKDRASLQKRQAYISDRAEEYHQRLTVALAASGSDYSDGPQEELVEAAYMLVLDGYCDVRDFAEWGWSRSQYAPTIGRYFSYCNRPAPLTKQWAMDEDGRPVR